MELRKESVRPGDGIEPMAPELVHGALSCKTQAGVAGGLDGSKSPLGKHLKQSIARDPKAWCCPAATPPRHSPACGHSRGGVRAGCSRSISACCRDPATARSPHVIAGSDNCKPTNDFRQNIRACPASLALAEPDRMTTMPTEPRDTTSRGPDLRTGIVHIHSSYSHDGRDTLEELRAFATARGIGFIAMSDHAEDFTSTRFAKFVRHCSSVSDSRLMVIPGLEYRFPGLPGLHLLAFGLRDWITPRTPEEFIAQATPRCGMTVLAHPVLARHQVPETVSAGIQAVEVWNAAYNTRYLPDPRSVEIVHQIRRRRPEVVAMAGLDQHDARNDRELRVVLDRASDDPLAELRAGRFRNVGRTLQFDAAASCRPSRLRALTRARWVLDQVNRLHERVARPRA